MGNDFDKQVKKVGRKVSSYTQMILQTLIIIVMIISSYKLEEQLVDPEKSGTFLRIFFTALIFGIQILFLNWYNTSGNYFTRQLDLTNAFPRVIVLAIVGYTIYALGLIFYNVFQTLLPKLEEVQTYLAVVLGAIIAVLGYFIITGTRHWSIHTVEYQNRHYPCLQQLQASAPQQSTLSEAEYTNSGSRKDGSSFQATS
ncbi:MAG: hypothetical protein EZS28_013755, partial [Streblomastix strix]